MGGLEASGWWLGSACYHKTGISLYMGTTLVMKGAMKNDKW